MADLTEMTPGEILADSSVADFIRELGLGIAAAQTALDDNSVRQMTAFTTRREDLGNRTLLDLGLVPAFYHYQHADISCSMQLRMEVGETSELGFGVRAGFGDTNRDESTSNETETSETSGSRTETKTARMTMRSDSAGALTLAGGQSFTPTGDNPAARLASLRQLLTAGDTGIDTLIERPPTTAPTMSLDQPTGKVMVSSPTVAFLRPDADNAAIRIRENVVTNYVVNAALTIPSLVQADLAAYAAHVEGLFRAEGYGTALIEPAARHLMSNAPAYDTGISDLRPADTEHLGKLADVLKGSGLRVEIEGFTDRQGARARNIDLGNARGEKVRAHLVAQGVPTGQIDLKASRGEAAHQAADATGPADNEAFRRTDITLLNLDYYLLTAGNGPDFVPGEIAPNFLDDPGGPNNGYVALYDSIALSGELSGNGVTIEGAAFPFDGSASGAGGAAGSAVAYARNFARDVNASPGLSAWSVGNVAHVARAQDTFDVRLYAVGSREVRIAETGGFTVTRQFSNTSSRIESADREANRTIAVGVSVDGRTSRQYGLEVTGNSTISARLVSVPAPPEFLEQIRAYQNGLDG